LGVIVGAFCLIIALGYFKLSGVVEDELNSVGVDPQVLEKNIMEADTLFKIWKMEHILFGMQRKRRLVMLWTNMETG